MKRVDPDHLLFAYDIEHARQFPKVLNEIRKLEDTRRIVALYRSHPEHAVQGNFVGMVKDLINTQHL